MVPLVALLLSGCFGGDTEDVTPTASDNTQLTPPTPTEGPTLEPDGSIKTVDDGDFTWNGYRNNSPTFLNGMNPDILDVPDAYYTGDVYTKEELDLLPRHLLYMYDRFLENSRGFESGQKPAVGVDILEQDLRELFTQEGIDQLKADYNSEPFNYIIISVIPGLFRIDGTTPDLKAAAVPWKYSYDDILIGYDKNGQISGYDNTLTVPVSATITLTITTEDGNQSVYKIASNWRMFYEPDYGWQIYSYSL